HGVLDQRLSAHAFLAGDDYSIADMASYPWIDVYPALTPDFSQYPHMKRWLDAISKRPATARAYAWTTKVNPDDGKPLSEEARKQLFGPATPRI
ncbi:MAG: glutathione binding-like protein, partial [Pseudoxanthomonas sp.]